MKTRILFLTSNMYLGEMGSVSWHTIYCLQTHLFRALKQILRIDHSSLQSSKDVSLCDNIGESIYLIFVHVRVLFRQCLTRTGFFWLHTFEKWFYPNNLASLLSGLTILDEKKRLNSWMSQFYTNSDSRDAYQRIYFPHYSYVNINCADSTCCMTKECHHSTSIRA